MGLTCYDPRDMLSPSVGKTSEEFAPRFSAWRPPHKAGGPFPSAGAPNAGGHRMRNRTLQIHRSVLGGYTIDGPYVRGRKVRKGWLRRIAGFFRTGR